MRWYAANNARNWLAYILCGRDYQTACQQQHRREYIMQPKDCIINLYLL